MFSRLPSCKITGALLVALVIFTFGLANAPRAEASADRVTVIAHATTEVNRIHPIKVEKVSVRDLDVTLNNGAVLRATPCRTEDSSNCYWLGRHRGNGHGRSFLALGSEPQVAHLWIRSALLNEAGL